MQVPYEIKKRLQSAMLPNYVLDWLTEKFVECQKYCDKAKELEQKVQQLERQIYQQNQGGQQQNYQDRGQQGQEVGYDYSQKGMSAHYKPWEEDLKYREHFPEYRRGRYSRYDFMNQGGGSGGGSGGSGGGPSSSYYVPQPERVPPRVVPVTDADPNQQRDTPQ